MPRSGVGLEAQTSRQAKSDDPGAAGSSGPITSADRPEATARQYASEASDEGPDRPRDTPTGRPGRTGSRRTGTDPSDPDRSGSRPSDRDRSGSRPSAPAPAAGEQSDAEQSDAERTAPAPAADEQSDAEQSDPEQAGSERHARTGPRRAGAFWVRLRRSAPGAAPVPPPAKRVPDRDPLWARLMIIFGAVLVLGAGGAIAATKGLADRYDSAVKKGTLIAPEARTNPEAPRVTVTGPLNYLLIGSDSRDAEGDGGGQRADAIIIVHIPAGLDRAFLISVPRDLLVKIPPFPQAGFLGGQEKINGAFDHAKGGDAGVQLLSATLKDLLGVTFDGAVVVDFEGFRKVVRLLGGVHMCIDERVESYHIGHDRNGNFLAPRTGPEGEYRVPGSTPEVYEPGCRHLRDWQALDYLRQRKSLSDGDFGRQRHHQQFLKALYDEARGQGLIRNPLKLDALIRSVGQSLTVDTSGVPLPDLAFALRDVHPASMIGIRLPSESRVIGGISYIVTIDPQASSLFEAIRADTMDEWTRQNPMWVNLL